MGPASSAWPSAGGRAPSAWPSAGDPPSSAWPSAGGPASSAWPSAGGPASAAGQEAGGPASSAWPAAVNPDSPAWPSAGGPASSAWPSAGGPASSAWPSAGPAPAHLHDRAHARVTPYPTGRPLSGVVLREHLTSDSSFVSVVLLTGYQGFEVAGDAVNRVRCDTSESVTVRCHRHSVSHSWYSLSTRNPGCVTLKCQAILRRSDSAHYPAKYAGLSPIIPRRRQQEVNN